MHICTKEIWLRIQSDDIFQWTEPDILSKVDLADAYERAVTILSLKWRKICSGPKHRNQWLNMQVLLFWNLLMYRRQIWFWNQRLEYIGPKIKTISLNWWYYAPIRFAASIMFRSAQS